MDTFPLFNSFPPEIHSLILASCSENDRICLRLTWYLPTSSALQTPSHPTDPHPLANISTPSAQPRV